MSKVRSRILITVINVIVLPVSLIFAFFVFIMGVFAGDSGTATAEAITYTIILLSVLYVIFTGIAIFLSQRRLSLKWALIPLVLPILFFIWVFGPFN